MVDSFQAFRVYQDQTGVKGRLETLTLEDLTPGEVVIKAAYSSINYKDALAATGKGAILKSLPLNPGIDVAGVVVSSEAAAFCPGDEVLVTGTGLGEERDGGLAAVVRTPQDTVVKLPAGLTLKEAMIYGTAGFTAALCLERLAWNRQVPSMGPIVVTGASGGVGSFAVALLAKRGFEVIAVSSKAGYAEALYRLGAKEVCTLEALQLSSKPLDKARFGGAIDNVGEETLARLLPSINLWGNVCSVGLASGAKLSGTVFPFILRGVSLIGISSNNTPMPLRQEIWRKLAGEWRLADLDRFVTETVALSEVPRVCEAMMARKTSGRFVVDCQR